MRQTPEKYACTQPLFVWRTPVHWIHGGSSAWCSPKLGKKEIFFQWCMWYRTEFDFNVLFIHLRTRKMPFNSPIFYLTLQSRIKLDTCYSFIKFGTGFCNSGVWIYSGAPNNCFLWNIWISIAWGRLEISIWRFQFCKIFEAYLIKSPRLYEDAVLAVFWWLHLFFQSGFVLHFYFRGLIRSEQ